MLYCPQDMSYANEAIPCVLQGDIPEARAWTRATLTPADWLLAWPEACVAELDTMVQSLRTSPRSRWQLTPEAFRLTACQAVMAQVRQRLERGPGLVVLDRLPVERYTVHENRAIGYVLAALLGQVVAQKWDGTRLYDVQDTGRSFGRGVRRSVTNLEQDFHTDGAWLWKHPAFIGLFCLQPAAQGGLSRCVSLLRVHNLLRRWHPEALQRLYQPFWWDRQAEHAPEEIPYSRYPVYHSEDGQSVTARYYEDYIFNGYKLAGETLDEAGRHALAVMRSITADPDNWVEFRMQQGQLQYVNNRQCAHARTAFLDHQAARHVLRLWNRDEGSPALEGQDDVSIDMQRV
ncbi:MAG: TauD/TfdA family dioxygenase [Candidatus Tectimicrobiota bacterium]